MGEHEALDWRGHEAIDRDGDKLGKLKDIFLDNDSDRPEWAVVGTGLLGRDARFVPLRGASEREGYVRLDFQKEQVEAAPDVDHEGELTPEQEQALYEHYGLDYGAGGSGHGHGEHEHHAHEHGEPENLGHEHGEHEHHGHEHGEHERRDAPGGEGLTRSEEEVHLGKESRPRQRVRLRKHVVTEYVTQRVPVQREEVRVEHEPVEGEPGPEPGTEERR